MARLVCWQCAEPLKGVPRPIRRTSRCPACRAELHACKLCRHFDPRLLGQCAHDRADRVVDKAQANFCTHFSPRPDAHRPPVDRNAAARAELAALFGVEGGDEDAGEPGAAPPADPRTRARSEAERARRELDALFGLDEEPE